MLRSARSKRSRATAPDSADVTVVRVPGAFELPAAARALSGRAGATPLAILAAIVKGETTHHEVLAHAVAGALASLSAETGHADRASAS